MYFDFKLLSEGNDICYKRFLNRKTTTELTICTGIYIL